MSLLHSLMSALDRSVVSQSRIEHINAYAAGAGNEMDYHLRANTVLRTLGAPKDPTNGSSHPSQRRTCNRPTSAHAFS